VKRMFARPAARGLTFGECAPDPLSLFMEKPL
jgi:hypothetical protein